MRKHNVFTISGSDYFTTETLPRVKDNLLCEVDVGYTPAEALTHWTGNADIVLKWSGPKDPYPTYELGTIKKGAWADLLLWSSNPLEDITVVTDEEKLDLIMKDGVIYKDDM